MWRLICDTYLISDIWCRMSDVIYVWYLMSDVWCVIYVCVMWDVWCVICTMTDVRRLTSWHITDIWHQTSDVFCLMSSGVWCQISDVRRLFSDVWCHMFYVRCETSHMWYMYDVWCQTFDVWYNYVWCETSDVWYITHITDIWPQLFKSWIALSTG